MPVFQQSVSTSNRYPLSVHIRPEYGTTVCSAHCYGNCVPANELRVIRWDDESGEFAEMGNWQFHTLHILQMSSPDDCLLVYRGAYYGPRTADGPLTCNILFLKEFYE